MKKLYNYFLKPTSLTCIVFILIAITSLTSCDKRSFPVTPQPEKFGQIPPSDVGLLHATGGDQTVNINWSSPPEDNIVKILIKNLNDGTEQTFDGNAATATITNLTNLVPYTFLVRAENDKGIISYGVKITEMPFKHDDIKPGPVTELVGFIVNDGSALAVWKNPQDPDLARIVIYMGNDSISVPRDKNYTIIKGDVKKDLIVKTVDFSGNYSDPSSAKIDQDMISIKGVDDGEYETLTFKINPNVTFIDQLKISWGTDKSEIISSTATSYKILLADLIWLDPIKVGLISDNALVTEYSYKHFNSLPGTIRLAFFDSKVGNINIEGDMRNIGGLNGGETATYNVFITETGSYKVSAYESKPDGTARYEVYVDNVLLGNGEVGATGAWDQFQPFEGPAINLPAGQHALTIKFLDGGANYQKFLFKKL